MAEHTPGPWHALAGNDNQTGNYPAEVVNATGHPVAYIPRVDPATSGDHSFNAHLIAAAPDLLAALEELLSSDTDMSSHQSTLDKAEAAIKKARGEN